MKVYPVEFLERCLKMTISLLKKQFESEMCTAPRRERRFVQKRARRAGESTVARPQQACRARAAHQKHWFFIGRHENAHRAKARAQFSNCAPRAGESSILPTPDGAHDHVSKQNEHRAEAGAPFSIKKRTARRREAQKCSSGAAKVLPLQRRAPYKSHFGPA